MQSIILIRNIKVKIIWFDKKTICSHTTSEQMNQICCNQIIKSTETIRTHNGT